MTFDDQLFWLTIWFTALWFCNRYLKTSKAYKAELTASITDQVKLQLDERQKEVKDMKEHFDALLKNQATLVDNHRKLETAISMSQNNPRANLFDAFKGMTQK